MTRKVVKNEEGVAEMNIGTVKTENEKLIIRTINKRGALSARDLGDEALDILKNKGRVYGIYQGKELAGFYMYERIEDFFVNEAELADKLLVESKAIYRLVSNQLSGVAEAYKDEIEKYIFADLKTQIEWGQIAGVQNGDKLLYRRSLDKKERGASTRMLGYGAGFAIGMMFGWLIFDSISMGLAFGVCYGIVGGLLLTNSTTKQEWKYVETEEKK
jgi:hypothetical protein